MIYWKGSEYKTKIIQNHKMILQDKSGIFVFKASYLESYISSHITNFKMHVQFPSSLSEYTKK